MKDIGNTENDKTQHRKYFQMPYVTTNLVLQYMKNSKNSTRRKNPTQ